MLTDQRTKGHDVFQQTRSKHLTKSTSLFKENIPVLNSRKSPQGSRMENVTAKIMLSWKELKVQSLKPGTTQKLLNFTVTLTQYY